MSKLTSIAALLALLAGTLVSASAQVQNTTYPPYHPGTSTWHAGPSQAGAGHVLLSRPHPWTQSSRPYPLIDASFRMAMQPQSVRITLDGRNVTEIAAIHSGGFEFTPAFRLALGMHSVRITGMTQSGQRISDGWSFTTTD